LATQTRAGTKSGVRSDIEKTRQRSSRNLPLTSIAEKSKTPRGEKFQHLLSIGIGGSALGPQFIAERLGQRRSIGHLLLRQYGFRMDSIACWTRSTVTRANNCGGDFEVRRTKETRNGMLEAEAWRFKAAGLDFCETCRCDHRRWKVISTSNAEKKALVSAFPMWDWVGGRTSVIAPVGPGADGVEGFEIDNFLAGAAAMAADTGKRFRQNAAMAARVDVVLRRQGSRRKRHGGVALQRSAAAFSAAIFNSW